MALGAVGCSQTGFANVNGANLHYEVAGQGPSLVLVHSAITDSRSWDSQFPSFSKQYRVLRYDLRGFGQSDVAHGRFSNADDLLAVMATVDMRTPALLGVSLGGSIALDTALEHPGVVAAMILVATPISGRERSAEYHARVAEIDRLLVERGMDAAVEREMELWVYGRGRTASDIDPHVRQAVREMDIYNSKRFSPDAAPERIEPPAIGRLHEIRVPTLVIVGDRDVDDVRQAAEELGGGIRGSRLVVMPGVAHVPNMEQPEEFNGLVLDFLSSVS